MDRELEGKGGNKGNTKGKRGIKPKGKTGGLRKEKRGMKEGAWGGG